jgi:hypothetical protein
LQHHPINPKANKMGSQIGGPRLAGGLLTGCILLAVSAQTSAAKTDIRPNEPALRASETIHSAPLFQSLIDDFESELTGLTMNSDRAESAIECGLDSASSYAGASSLRIHYVIAPGGWVHCGRTFDPADWSGSQALSLWFQADTATWVTVGISSGSLDSTTLYEARFEIVPRSLGGWNQIVLPWNTFDRGGQGGSGGLEEDAASQVTGYWFRLDANEAGRVGTLWIDDVELADLGPSTPPLSLSRVLPLVALTLLLGVVVLVLIRRRQAGKVSSDA